MWKKTVETLRHLLSRISRWWGSIQGRRIPGVCHLPTLLPARSTCFFSNWSCLNDGRGMVERDYSEEGASKNNQIQVLSCFSGALLVKTLSDGGSAQISAFPVSLPSPCLLGHVSSQLPVLVSGLAGGCPTSCLLPSPQCWCLHCRLCWCSLLAYYSLKFN